MSEESKSSFEWLEEIEKEAAVEQSIGEKMAKSVFKEIDEKSHSSDNRELFARFWVRFFEEHSTFKRDPFLPHLKSLSGWDRHKEIALSLYRFMILSSHMSEYVGPSLFLTEIVLAAKSHVDSKWHSIVMASRPKKTSDSLEEEKEKEKEDSALEVKRRILAIVLSHPYVVDWDTVFEGTPWSWNWLLQTSSESSETRISGADCLNILRFRDFSKSDLFIQVFETQKHSLDQLNAILSLLREKAKNAEPPAKIGANFYNRETESIIGLFKVTRQNKKYHFLFLGKNGVLYTEKKLGGYVKYVPHYYNNVKFSPGTSKEKAYDFLQDLEERDENLHKVLNRDSLTDSHQQSLDRERDQIIDAFFNTPEKEEEEKKEFEFEVANIEINEPTIETVEDVAENSSKFIRKYVENTLQSSSPEDPLSFNRFTSVDPSSTRKKCFSLVENVSWNTEAYFPQCSIRKFQVSDLATLLLKAIDGMTPNGVTREVFRIITPDSIFVETQKKIWGLEIEIDEIKQEEKKLSAEFNSTKFLARTKKSIDEDISKIKEKIESLNSELEIVQGELGYNSGLNLDIEEEEPEKYLHRDEEETKNSKARLEKLTELFKTEKSKLLVKEAQLRLPEIEKSFSLKNRELTEKRKELNDMKGVQYLMSEDKEFKYTDFNIAEEPVISFFFLFRKANSDALRIIIIDFDTKTYSCEMDESSFDTFPLFQQRFMKALQGALVDHLRAYYRLDQ